MAADQKKRELPIILKPPKPPTKVKHKSGRGRIRAFVLVLVYIVIILHISHFYVSGRTVSPVEPSESMYTLEMGHINAGAVFFVVAIVGTAIFGRFFCGWACHLIALQDLCGYVLRKCGIRLKPLRSRMLALLPFAMAFYMFFWPTVKRLWYGNPHPGFSNHLMTEDFWRTFPVPAVAILTFLVCGGLIVYLLGNKGFCTYACPYGAFFYVSDLVAVGKIRVTDACRHCGQCTAACTSNVAVSKEVKEFGMVVDPGCMKCMDCVSSCPNDALYYGFSQSVPGRQGSVKRTYDFSIAEDVFGLIVVGVTVFALRGLYDVVPFLLAVALGVITAYLLLQFLKLIRRPDLRIQQLQLKRGGSVTTTGWLAAGILCVWLAFSAHSFFVQYHRYNGRQNLAKIDVILEELFVAGPRQFTTAEEANIQAANTSFHYSDRFGLAPVFDVKVGLAATSIMNKDVEAATEYLRQAYELRPAVVRPLLIEFLGTQGRIDEAKELFQQ